RSRRDAIEHAIHDAAAPAEDGATDPVNGEDLTATAESALSDVTNWTDEREIIYFSPATVWPKTPAWAVAEESCPPPSSARADCDPPLPYSYSPPVQPPAGPGPAPPTPPGAVASHVQEQLPMDSLAAANRVPGPPRPSRPLRRHPAVL